MKFMTTEIPAYLSVRAIHTAYHFPLLVSAAVGDVHDFPEIFYLHKGENHMLIDGKSVHLREGQMILYRPLAYHVSEVLGEQMDVYILSFDLESKEIESLYNRPITLSPEYRLRFMELVEFARTLIQSVPHSPEVRGMARRESATDYDLQRLGNALEDFLIDLIRAGGGKPTEEREAVAPCVVAAEEFLMSNLHRPLTLAEIAAAAHVSVSTLTSAFRRHCDCSVISHFNALRIERARRELFAGRRNVTEVAAALGFSSVHYFSRLYRKHTGHSPSEDCP